MSSGERRSLEGIRGDGTAEPEDAGILATFGGLGTGVFSTEGVGGVTAIGVIIEGAIDSFVLYECLGTRFEGSVGTISEVDLEIVTGMAES
jgi:hypothetical protein